MTRLLAVAVLGLLAAGSAPAAFVTYTSRAAWLAAAGPLSGTETFNGFAADAQFRTASVAIANGSLTGTTGNNGTATNKVDASPFEFSGIYAIDGTAYLLGDLVNNQAITLTFTAPVTAWGGDFLGIANGGRPTVIDVFSSASTLLGTITPANGTNSDLAFYGFALTAGQAAGRLVIRNPGAANDVFGLDNTGFVVQPVSAVPAPPAVALALMGLASAGGAARLRRRLAAA